MNPQVGGSSYVFDEDYLYFYEPRLEERRDADAETVWRLLELEPEMEVLDLACGNGRIANRLAEWGARVIALDVVLHAERRPAAASPNSRLRFARLAMRRDGRAVRDAVWRQVVGTHPGLT